MAKRCARCGYSEFPCSVHEHHINGKHRDNRRQNKVDLCANCHHGLHNGYWDISELGITVSTAVKPRGTPKHNPYRGSNDDIPLGVRPSMRLSDLVRF